MNSLFLVLLDEVKPLFQPFFSCMGGVKIFVLITGNEGTSETRRAVAAYERKLLARLSMVPSTTNAWGPSKQIMPQSGSSVNDTCQMDKRFMWNMRLIDELAVKYDLHAVCCQHGGIALLIVFKDTWNPCGSATGVQGQYVSQHHMLHEKHHDTLEKQLSDRVGGEFVPSISVRIRRMAEASLQR